MSDWYTPREIAEQLGVNVDRVRGWIHAGELEAVNVADGVRPRWRISTGAYKTFLETRAAVQKVSPRKPRRRFANSTEYF